MYYPLFAYVHMIIKEFTVKLAEKSQIAGTVGKCACSQFSPQIQQTDFML